jgi:Fanconi anemia group M protein
MLNRRLINQLQELQQVEKKLLIIEGIDEQELYGKNKDNNEPSINENAIRGFLLSIVLNYKVPIIFTKNYEDTAKFLVVLSKKQEKEKELGLNVRKRTKDVNEQMQYIIESFPGIGPKTAKKLLKEFKTIRDVLNASGEELNKLIGKKAEIFKLATREYR